MAEVGAQESEESQPAPEGPSALSVAFGGKIQLQKEGERIWKKITRKIRIEDGDLIKTGYKSYIIIRVGGKNQIIIGSNSKVLIKMPAAETEGFNTVLTVFDGGAYLTWNGPQEIQMLSNEGLAISTRAGFAFIYEKDKANTHVINLDGKTMAMNITRKTPIELTKGQFTIIKANSNPTEPDLITTQSTDLLRKFFGDKFVNNELEKSGVKVQAAVTKKAVAEKAVKAEVYDEDIRVKPMFNITEVLKKVRATEGGDKESYNHPFWYDDLSQHQYYAEANFHYLSAAPETQGITHNGLKIRGGMQRGRLSFGVNVPMVTNKDNDYTISASGPQGILDKIYYINYSTGNEKLYLHAGEIRNLTINKGVLVRDFSNEIRSQVPQPLGVQLVWEPSLMFKTHYFVADVSKPDLMGLNFLFETGYTSLGIGGVADLNQGEGYTFGDGAEQFRADVAGPEPIYPSGTGGIYAAEFFLESSMVQELTLNIFAYATMGIVFADDFGYEGLAAQFPGISIYLKKWHFFGEGITSLKHFHPGYFNNFYMEDRARIYPVTDPVNGAGTLGISQIERHPPMEKVLGYRFGVEWRILHQLWAGAAYGQNFSATRLENVQENPAIRPEDRELYNIKPDRNIKLRLFAGNELVSGLKRFEIYYHLQGGGLGVEFRNTPKTDSTYLDTLPIGRIPDNFIDTVLISATRYEVEIPMENSYPYLGTATSNSVFYSLNAMFGARIEYGVMPNASILAEFRGFSHDFSGNGIYDEGEIVSELSATWRMKF